MLLIVQAFLKFEEWLRSEYNLSFPQFWAILALHNHPDCTSGELCKFTSMAYSTGTAMIDRLEVAGYLERKRSREDRRVIHLGIPAQKRRDTALMVERFHHLTDDMPATVTLYLSRLVETGLADKRPVAVGQ